MVKSKNDSDHYRNPTMTTNTEPVIETDSLEYRETASDESAPTEYSTEDLQRDGATPGYRPIPGMDILTVVYQEARRRAENGVPPAYAFLRIDIYLLAQAANSAQGVMNWVDANLNLNCYILPLMPGEGQAPFILCNTLEEAAHVLIGSFPKGTFTEVPAEDEDLSSSTADAMDGCPVDDIAPTVTEVVETTDG